MIKKKVRFYFSRYILTSPLKIQRILKELRTFNYNEILIILKFLPYRISKLIFKLLKSFIFTLYNKKDVLNLVKLFTLKKSFVIGVTRGPILKRSRPKAKGQNTIIRKRISHIFIKLN